MSAEKWGVNTGSDYLSPRKELEEIRRIIENDIVKPAARAIWDRVPIESSGWSPAVDAIDRDEAFVLKIELPGINREEVELTVSENSLTIKGTRTPEPSPDAADYRRQEISYGHFFRNLTLPQGLDSENVEAVYENGLLTVTIAKQTVTRSRKINIDVK